MLLNQYLQYQETISTEGSLFNYVTDYRQIGSLGDIKKYFRTGKILTFPSLQGMLKSMAILHQLLRQFKIDEYSLSGTSSKQKMNSGKFLLC